MTIEERIRLVDSFIEDAKVSLAGLTSDEIELAKKLCEHFELKFGTLLRRTAAIELIGGSDTTVDRLREAAQHLIYD
jgi:hypothetical protein